MTAVELDQQAARVEDATAQESATPVEQRRRGRGPRLAIIIGVSLVAGVVLAKVLDWKSRASDRD